MLCLIQDIKIYSRAPLWIEFPVHIYMHQFLGKLLASRFPLTSNQHICHVPHTRCACSASFRYFRKGLSILHAHAYTRNRSSFKLRTTHVYVCIGSQIFFVSISLSSSVVFQFDPFLICYHIRFYEYERYLFCLISFRSTCQAYSW